MGGADGDPGASTINVANVNGGPPGGANGDPKAPTINATNVDGGPPGSLGGPVSIHDPQVCCDLHGQHR
jgi:hypothetical protein